MDDQKTCGCAYCYSEVIERDCNGNPSEAVPATSDDDAWNALAKEHSPDCEWIATRAHRIDSDSYKASAE